MTAVKLKKYSNRKIYNSDVGKYLSLSDIRELIKKDKNISVVDHDTGADVTSETLHRLAEKYTAFSNDELITAIKRIGA